STAPRRVRPGRPRPGPGHRNGAEDPPWFRGRVPRSARRGERPPRGRLPSDTWRGACRRACRDSNVRVSFLARVLGHRCCGRLVEGRREARHTVRVMFAPPSKAGTKNLIPTKGAHKGTLRYQFPARPMVTGSVACAVGGPERIVPFQRYLHDRYEPSGRLPGHAVAVAER